MADKEENEHPGKTRDEPENDRDQHEEEGEDGEYDEADWEVGKLLAKRKTGKDTEYKVLWAGCTEGEEGATSWELASWLRSEGYDNEMQQCDKMLKRNALENQKKSEAEAAELKAQKHAAEVKKKIEAAAAAAARALEKPGVAGGGDAVPSTIPTSGAPLGAKAPVANVNTRLTMKKITQLLEFLPAFQDADPLLLQQPCGQKKVQLDLASKEQDKEFSVLAPEDALVKRIKLGLPYTNPFATADDGGSKAVPAAGGGPTPVAVPTGSQSQSSQRGVEKKGGGKHLNRSMDEWVTGLEQVLLRNLDLLRALHTCRWDVDASWHEYMNPTLPTKKQNNNKSEKKHSDPTAAVEFAPPAAKKAAPEGEVKKAADISSKEQEKSASATAEVKKEHKEVIEAKKSREEEEEKEEEEDWVNLSEEDDDDSFELLDALDGLRPVGSGGGCGTDDGTGDPNSNHNLRDDDLNSEEQEEWDNMFMFAPTTFYESADILLMVMSFSGSHTFFNACGVSKRWRHVGRRMHEARGMAFDVACNFRGAVLKMGFWPLALCEADVQPRQGKSFLRSLRNDVKVTEGGGQIAKGSSSRYDGKNGGEVWPMFRNSPTHFITGEALTSYYELYQSPQANLRVFNLAAKEDANTSMESTVVSNSENIIPLYLGRSPTQTSGNRVMPGLGASGATPANVSFSGGRLSETNIPVLAVKGLMLGGPNFRQQLQTTLYKEDSREFKEFFKIPEDPTTMLRTIIDDNKRRKMEQEEAMIVAEESWIRRIEKDLLEEKRAAIPKRKSKNAEKAHVTKEELAKAVRGAREEFRLHKLELEEKRRYRESIGKRLLANQEEEQPTSQYGVPPPVAPKRSKDTDDAKRDKDGNEEKSLLKLAGANATYFNTKLQEYADQWAHVHATRARWEAFAFSLPAPVMLRNHTSLKIATDSAHTQVTHAHATEKISAIRQQSYKQMKQMKPHVLVGSKLSEYQLHVLGEFSDHFVSKKAGDELAQHGW